MLNPFKRRKRKQRCKHSASVVDAYMPYLEAGQYDQAGLSRAINHCQMLMSFGSPAQQEHYRNVHKKLNKAYRNL